MGRVLFVMLGAAILLVAGLSVGGPRRRRLIYLGIATLAVVAESI